MLAFNDRSRPAAPTYHPLALLVCALATGIAIDRWLAMAALAWWLIALLAIDLWLPLWLARRDTAASWLTLVAFLATGGAGHHLYWRLYRADEIGRMMHEKSRPICVEAVAITSPRWVPAPAPTPLRTIPQGEQSELLVWITAIRDGRSMRP